MWTGQYLVTTEMTSCVEMNGWRESYGLGVGCDDTAHALFQNCGASGKEVMQMARAVIDGIAEEACPWLEIDPYDPRRMFLFAKRHGKKYLRIWDNSFPGGDCLADAILIQGDEQRPTLKQMLAIDQRCTRCIASTRCARHHLGDKGHGKFNRPETPKSG